jgi:hypothetical protein
MNSVDICVLVSWAIISNILVPGMFLFSSGIYIGEKVIRVYKIEFSVMSQRVIMHAATKCHVSSCSWKEWCIRHVLFADLALVFHVYVHRPVFACPDMVLLIIQLGLSDSICSMSSTTPRRAVGSASRTTTSAAGSQSRPMPMLQIRRGHRQTKEQLLPKTVRERDTLHANFFLSILSSGIIYIYIYTHTHHIYI